VPGFSDPENDDFAPGLNGRFDQVDSANETCSQSLTKPLKFGDFQVEHTSGLFNVVHRYIIVG